MIPGRKNTPTEIEAVLVNLVNSQKALSDAVTSHEKLIIQNRESLSEADKAYEKAKIDATRLDVNNRIAEENRKTEIKNAEQEIEKAEINIERMLRLVATNGEILSPVSGTIAEISAAEGAEVTEGAVIAKIASDGMTKQLKANVSSSDAKQLKIGMEAEMYTNMMWSMGKISNISKSKDDANIYVVTFDINPGYGSFNVGDSVRVNIRKTSDRYYTIVPLSALREDSNGKFVFLLQEESGALGNRLTVRRVDVTVQEQNNERAAVSGALSDWDKVVERGDRELKDGDRVRIQQ